MRARGGREQGDKHSHCQLQCRQQQEGWNGISGMGIPLGWMAEELQTLRWHGVGITHTDSLGWDERDGNHTQALGWDEPDGNHAHMDRMGLESQSHGMG